MRRSSLTAILAVLCIILGALIFGWAIVAELHAVTLLGMIAIGAGILLACQGGGQSEPAAH